MADQPDEAGDNDAAGVLNRADALMLKRRRSFVAIPGGLPNKSDGVPPDDEDVPVLTEVVSAEEIVAKPVNKRLLDETQISLIAAEMSEAIQQQLVFELPTLIEAVLVSAGEELRAGITETMEMAMRDFIARRKQLRLPLDEQ